MSKPFHIVLHAGDPMESVDSKFGCSFEQLTESFEKLPRMFLEPDGSFVWVIEIEGSRFQMDGLLTDDGSNLLNCELKGTCEKSIWEQFLGTLGWPTQSVVVQLVQSGTFVSESEFRSAFEIE